MWRPDHFSGDQPETLNIGVVGATGETGGAFLNILLEHQEIVGDLRTFASEHSEGLRIAWQDRNLRVEKADTAHYGDLDVVCFFAGSQASLRLVPRIVEESGLVIDNSSAWRKDPEVPLVVSEVNPEVREPSSMNPSVSNASPAPAGLSVSCISS